MSSCGRGHSDTISQQQSKLTGGATIVHFNFLTCILEAILEETLCISWIVTKSKFRSTRKGYFPIHVRRCTTCSRILLGKSATHLVLFQRLDSFNEIPGPSSVGLSGVASVYFSLDFGGILVEKFVGLKEILNIDRVFCVHEFGPLRLG